MRLFGSLMASPTTGPLTMLSTGPSIMAAAALALAGALAGRLAEQVEEAARHVLGAVEQSAPPARRRAGRAAG